MKLDNKITKVAEIDAEQNEKRIFTPTSFANVGSAISVPCLTKHL